MAAGLSARSVVRHLTVAHGVFKYAARAHGLLRNPASADLVDRPTVRYSGDFDTYDATELAALARHATDAQDATLYFAAAMTGLRQGELLALRWRDIDFARQRVHVRRAWSQAGRYEKAPKSGKVRSVPLVSELVGPFDRLSRREHFTGDDDLVFRNDVGERAWTPGRCAAATTLPSSAPAFAACASTICATPSARPPSRRSRSPTCRRCSATRTSRPPSATSTTARAPTTPPGSRRRSAAIPCPRLCPEPGTQAQISATQRLGFG